MTSAEPLPATPAPPVRFHVQQRVTPFQNSYRVLADDRGAPGDLIAFAQQKRMAFKEEVTFYADEQRTIPVFSFKARKRLDLAATYDVFDAQGTPIGQFRKDFKASLLNSTYHLEAAGVEATGSERNMLVAILRRVQDTIPLAVHYDFNGGVGRPIADARGGHELRPLGQNGGVLRLVPQGSGLAVVYPDRCTSPREWTMSLSCDSAHGSRGCRTSSKCARR